MKLFSAAVLFLVCVQRGYSIRCYECNSQNNSMCLDPSLYDKESVDKYLKVADCDQNVYTAGAHNYFCRKMVQTILHKHETPMVRVSRGCGWVRHHKDCYKMDSESHLETVCQCFTDDCNAAVNVRYCVGTILTAIIMFVLRY